VPAARPGEFMGEPNVYKMWVRDDRNSWSTVVFACSAEEAERAGRGIEEAKWGRPILEVWGIEAGGGYTAPGMVDAFTRACAEHGRPFPWPAATRPDPN